MYKCTGIYSRDREISTDADFTSFGGNDVRAVVTTPAACSGRVGQTGLGRRSPFRPTPHAFAPNVQNDPEYKRISGNLTQVNSSSSTSAIFRRFLLLIMNSFTAHSTRRFAANTWSFLVISSSCAVSGTAPWRRSHLRRYFRCRSFLRISPIGISVPIQNPFNPFTVADYTSPEE